MSDELNEVIKETAKKDYVDPYNITQIDISKGVTADIGEVGGAILASKLGTPAAGEAGARLGKFVGKVSEMGSPGAKVINKVEEKVLEDDSDKKKAKTHRKPIKKAINNPYAVATATAKKAGYKRFTKHSAGRKKRDQIAEKLQKENPAVAPITPAVMGNGQTPMRKMIGHEESPALEMKSAIDNIINALAVGDEAGARASLDLVKSQITKFKLKGKDIKGVISTTERKGLIGGGIKGGALGSAAGTALGSGVGLLTGGIPGALAGGAAGGRIGGGVGAIGGGISEQMRENKKQKMEKGVVADALAGAGKAIAEKHLGADAAKVGESIGQTAGELAEKHGGKIAGYAKEHPLQAAALAAGAGLALHAGLQQWRKKQAEKQATATKQAPGAEEGVKIPKQNVAQEMGNIHINPQSSISEQDIAAKQVEAERKAKAAYSAKLSRQEKAKLQEEQAVLETKRKQEEAERAAEAKANAESPLRSTIERINAAKKAQEKKKIVPATKIKKSYDERVSAILHLEKAINLIKGYEPARDEFLQKMFEGAFVPSIFQDELSRPPASWLEMAISKSDIGNALSVWYGADKLAKAVDEDAEIIAAKYKSFGKPTTDFVPVEEKGAEEDTKEKEKDEKNHVKEEKAMSPLAAGTLGALGGAVLGSQIQKRRDQKANQMLGKSLLTKMQIDTTDMADYEMELLGKAMLDSLAEIEKAVMVSPEEQEKVDTGEGSEFSDGTKEAVKELTGKAKETKTF